MVVQRLVLSLAALVTLCCIARIETAVIPTEEFGNKIQQMLNENAVDGSRLIRAVENGTESNSTRICVGDYMPCGWEVYERFTRKHEYYVKSTCDCAPGFVCIRGRDELSTSAYSYFCRRDTRTDDDRQEVCVKKEKKMEDEM
ncbi:hypothetical protein KM043_008079 [Ampulex compressa]|uniref:Venom protein n=1 Tax=Ampulex compressa TaxID=860918 RepID=A0A1W6EVQ5_AMPCP|nr:venom protein [Ampulex compressa]KAG7188433.1 hypothetical protein KM043_008079 [Ampulex compressa]